MLRRTKTTTYTPKNELVIKQVTFNATVLYTFKSNGKNINFKET